MHQDVTVVRPDLTKWKSQVHAIVADAKIIMKRKQHRNEAVSFFSALAPCLISGEVSASALCGACQRNAQFKRDLFIERPQSGYTPAWLGGKTHGRPAALSRSNAS
ncbi:hypothetical protein ABVF61_07225 [Roseibium sp. HPY-6]|uniref:hypothetical protein n=1 Tax=Roseibium sp. HPY-6 TaxID=3229852 RepID=UPI00338F6E84